MLRNSHLANAYESITTTSSISSLKIRNAIHKYPHASSFICLGINSKIYTAYMSLGRLVWINISFQEAHNAFGAIMQWGLYLNTK